MSASSTNLRKQELLSRLSKLAGSQAHRDFLELIQLNLETLKEQMVNSPPVDLPSLQGRAKGLHDLLTDLRRAPLPPMLNKDAE